MHPRERLPKIKLTSNIEKSANRILDEYLHGDENIPEITDKGHAMGKTITINSGTIQKETSSRRKNKSSNRNRREKVEG